MPHGHKHSTPYLQTVQLARGQCGNASCGGGARSFRRFPDAKRSFRTKDRQVLRGLLFRQRRTLAGRCVPLAQHVRDGAMLCLGRRERCAGAFFGGRQAAAAGAAAGGTRLGVARTGPPQVGGVCALSAGVVASRNGCGCGKESHCSCSLPSSSTAVHRATAARVTRPRPRARFLSTCCSPGVMQCCSKQAQTSS